MHAILTLKTAANLLKNLDICLVIFVHRQGDPVDEHDIFG